MKQTLKELCAIPSVQGAPEEGMPFGKDVYRALEYFLGLGEKFGFKAVNYDGYVGEIVWEGKTNEEIAVLCHLDVVKSGTLSDWKYPPFTPAEADGRIYARGTLDDKGPAVSILYMMKELKDEGFVPSKTIKFILGCNEESGWACIEHYNKVAKMPEVGFSPDGNFPVIYAEKGILHVRYEFECDKSLVIKGGEMANMVCDKAYATSPLFKQSTPAYAKAEKLCRELGLTIENGKIESRGVSAHGSTPECGKNAIDPLLLCLCELGYVDKSVYKSLFGDCYDLKTLHDETGYLTMSPDIIQAENGKMQIVTDFRYPSTLNPIEAERLVGQIGRHEILSHQKPLFCDKEDELIKTLSAIYNEECGTQLQPVAIGGGTYARALKRGVAFGPEFPGEEAPVHQPNEYVTLENFEKMSVIYKRALKALCE